MDKNKPDFDELNDRLIADSPSSPGFVIKTNLDSKNVEDENPYFNEHATAEEKEKLKKFFE